MLYGSKVSISAIRDLIESTETHYSSFSSWRDVFIDECRKSKRMAGIECTLGLEKVGQAKRLNTVLEWKNSQSSLSEDKVAIPWQEGGGGGMHSQVTMFLACETPISA